jgi:hypothetical protein
LQYNPTNVLPQLLQMCSVLRFEVSGSRFKVKKF